MDPTTAWAQDVVDGHVVAGQFMRLACERHLRDIRDGERRGIYWRPDDDRPGQCAHALRFFPSVLSVTAGAMVGKPFELHGYLTFVIGSLFGWRRADGLMRFRTAWLETGKGMVKSPTLAAVGIYLMGYCGIERSECYAIAKDRKQANVLFQDAVKMCQAQIPGKEEGDTLESLEEVVIRGTGEISWLIEHPGSRSKFLALAGDEKVNGPRPSFVAADEIHEWKSDGPIRTWKQALVKMPGNALLFLATNTPAEDQPVGTEYSEQHQAILRGEIEDDTAFAFIARTDPADKPMEDERCWSKSMPLLGLTFPPENVRAAVASAKHSMAASMDVKRLYFGVPVGVAEYWIDLDAWQSVQGRLEPVNLRRRKLWLSLDLSKKNDLTALGIGWRDDDAKLCATVRYWKPREKLADAAKADHAQYVEWSQPQQDGGPPHLNAVPGRTIEYDFVAQEVKRLYTDHDVELMAVDPAFLSDFLAACERVGLDVWVWSPDVEIGTGLKIVIHGQGTRGMNSDKMLWMPRSLGQLEDMILNGQIIIDENPVTKYCSGNAAIKPDAQGNRFFVKKRQRGRIDGLVVLAMLSGAAEMEAATEGRSIYEDDAAYEAVYGRPAEVKSEETDETKSDEWDPAILANMSHPAFAEHKRRFEAWQDAQPEDAL